MVTAQALVRDALNTPPRSGPVLQLRVDYWLPRRLDAGCAATTANRAEVAQRVEAALRLAAATAVRPDAPSAANADAGTF